MEKEITVTDVTRKKRIINIGVATIVLDKDSQVIEAMFDPLIRIKDCTNLVEELKKIDGPMENQAELVFASWFTKLNDIELADREKYSITVKNMGASPLPENYPAFSKAHKFLFRLEEI